METNTNTATNPNSFIGIYRAEVAKFINGGVTTPGAAEGFAAFNLSQRFDVSYERVVEVLEMVEA